MYSKINEIEQIGLSKRESEIYMALLQKKEFAATEIAAITDVTRTKVYEILQNLEIKGLCVGIQKNNRKKYRAIDPKIAFQNIISQDEKKLNAKRDVANQLAKSLHSLFKKNIYENNPLDYIEVISDKKQIGERWLKLEKNAKNEILIFNKEPYATTVAENLIDEIELIKKNIRYRAVYEFNDIKTESEKEEFVEFVSSFNSIGEEVRLVNKLQMKMAIVDNKTTMLALRDPVSFQQSITTIVVTHPSFALSQRYVFDSIWQKAITFDEYKTMIGYNKNN